MGRGCGFLAYLIVPVYLHEVVLEFLTGILVEHNLFPLFTGFSNPPVMRTSKYEIFTILPPGVGIVADLANLTPSSVSQLNTLLGP